jgi:hypothetical protein
VESAVRYFREQVPVVRRRYGGHVAEEHAKDVIAAEYRHTPARGASGAQAPDPQLHSHVVISGAVREDTQHAHITDHRPDLRGRLPERIGRRARPYCGHIGCCGRSLYLPYLITASRLRSPS